MKQYLLLLALIFFGIKSIAQSQNLLSSKYAKQELKSRVVPKSNWTPFPSINDRTSWAKADQEMMKAFLKTAEANLNYSWPSIPATKSLLIQRTGDRNEYQAVAREKRTILGTMLLAEIYENKGRFIDPIINGVWNICEESFWGVPAHLPQSKEYSGLMDVSQPFVELFSAETATMLSWVDYFLGEKLDSVSPQIRKRIYFETNNRIFEPLMTKAHGWMRTNANGRRPNNWNPWICSNWLNSVLLLEKDETKRIEHVSKVLEILDEFLNPYPEDGGCDEGPGYWGAAAASLYDNISLLNLATNNSFDYVYKQEKFKNMGRFIYRAQIGKTYFLNFADADPQPRMSSNMIYRYGKDIRDNGMMQFGAYYREQSSGQIEVFHYFRNLFSLFMQGEFQSAAKGLPLPANVWLPDLQVMISRDKQGTTDGWFIAAKGGNNDESHNHNDIGNYVVYYDGEPLLIDVGRGTYTRKTFSSRRYEIWYNCSDYHNVPTINGYTQSPGPKFQATRVDYKEGNGFSEISLDISKSYPDSAGINSWKRTVRLNKGKNVEVVDMLSLKHASKITEHIITCYPTEIVKPGELLIHFQPKDAGSKDFIIKYDPKQLVASVEKVPLTSMEDAGIITKWGNRIYRINFKVQSPKKTDKIRFEIVKK